MFKERKMAGVDAGSACQPTAYQTLLSLLPICIIFNNFYVYCYRQCLYLLLCMENTGCFGGSCTLDIGSSCPTGNNSACNGPCKKWVGKGFQSAQCIAAPRGGSKNYNHCRCFYSGC